MFVSLNFHNLVPNNCNITFFTSKSVIVIFTFFTPLPSKKAGLRGRDRERMDSERAMILPVIWGKPWSNGWDQRGQATTIRNPYIILYTPLYTSRKYLKNLTKTDIYAAILDFFLIMIRCVALFCTWGRGSYHSGRNHQKVRNIKPYQNTAPPQTDRTIRKARTLEMMWKARIELPS